MGLAWKESNNTGTWCLKAPSGDAVNLPYPFFSRLNCADYFDPMVLGDSIRKGVAEALSHARIPWIGQASLIAGVHRWAIQPVGVSEAVDASSFHQATAIQFQLYGSLRQRTPATKYEFWSPSLPAELESYEDLATKLEAVRHCLPKRCPIGAALIARDQTIYEDIRFLIDAGFDWLELIQSPHYGLRPNAQLELCNSPDTPKKALKARTDARREHLPLWLTTKATTHLEITSFLEMGFNGVCIDGFLAAKAPVRAVQRDTLAGIRVQSVSQQATDLSWLTSELNGLTEFYEDFERFLA